jgi:hypothetical protein
VTYLGDIALGQTLDFNFTTRQISGAPSTLSSSPVLSCYVGNNTTELTAGITLSVDFDSRTGLNHVRIVATSGNGYATASDYSVVITTGTVNSVSVVGEVIGDFSIENRQSNVKFWNGTAVSSPATAGIPDVNVKNINNVSASSVTTVNANQGTTGVVTFTVAGQVDSNVKDWAGTAVSAPATAGIPEVNIKNMNNVSAAAITTVKAVQGLAVDGQITTVTGNVNGSVGSVTGAVGSVTGAVGSVTGAVGSVTGAVGSVTGNVGGNVVGSVGSLTTNNDKTGYTLSNTGIDALYTRALTESYAAKGAAYTVAQALFAITQKLYERSITGTTETINGLDGTTAKMTETLNDGTNPTAITRAT